MPMHTNTNYVSSNLPMKVQSHVAYLKMRRCQLYNTRDPVKSLSLQRVSTNKSPPTGKQKYLTAYELMGEPYIFKRLTLR